MRGTWEGVCCNSRTTAGLRTRSRIPRNERTEQSRSRPLLGRLVTSRHVTSLPRNSTIVSDRPKPRARDEKETTSRHRGPDEERQGTTRWGGNNGFAPVANECRKRRFKKRRHRVSGRKDRQPRNLFVAPVFRFTDCSIDQTSQASAPSSRTPPKTTLVPMQRFSMFPKSPMARTPNTTSVVAPKSARMLMAANQARNSTSSRWLSVVMPQRSGMPSSLANAITFEALPLLSASRRPLLVLTPSVRSKSSKHFVLRWPPLKTPHWSRL